MMRGHASTIEGEIRRMVADWGDATDEWREIDILDFFAELTIYTTSSCLIGKPFREELDSTFAQHYHELERGTDAIAYVDPYADIESFRRRDAARERLVELVQGIIDKRQARGTVPKEDDVRRPPHVVGHRVVGADRADAASRRHARRGR
jgi:sterol 14-demethylase